MSTKCFDKKFGPIGQARTEISYEVQKSSNEIRKRSNDDEKNKISMKNKQLDVQELITPQKTTLSPFRPPQVSHCSTLGTGGNFRGHLQGTKAGSR